MKCNFAFNYLTENAIQKDQEFTMNLLMDIFSVTKNVKSDEEAYRSLEMVISNHEYLILTEDWEEEETYALGALSVAKHSALFWKNYNFSDFFS